MPTQHIKVRIWYFFLFHSRLTINQGILDRLNSRHNLCQVGEGSIWTCDHLKDEHRSDWWSVLTVNTKNRWNLCSDRPASGSGGCISGGPNSSPGGPPSCMSWIFSCISTPDSSEWVQQTCADPDKLVVTHLASTCLLHIYCWVPAKSAISMFGLRYS